MTLSLNDFVQISGLTTSGSNAVQTEQATTLSQLATVLSPAIGTSPRTKTFVIAASNSVNASTADYVCTGTNDHLIINAALAALPSFGQAGARAGTVLLRAGTYNIGASIVIDGDYTTLEGENFPMWGGYNNPWSGTGSPAGAIGVGPAKIQASATGYDLISIQNNNIPAGTGSNSQDNNRHRGICIRNLYLVGNNYSAQGISTTYGATPLAGGDDWSLIENNMITRCTNGINVGVDSWTIRNNSIQDCSGIGISISGTNGTVVQNLVFDIGGNYGIYATSGNCIIDGNRVGDILGTSSNGILCNGGSSIIANQVTNTNESGIVANGNSVSVTGNAVFTNCPNGGAPITINGGNNNTICGNTIGVSSGSSSAAAIYLGSGTPNTVSGNNISGTFSAGYVLASSSANLAANYVWHNDPATTLIGTTAGTVASSITLNGNTKTFEATFAGYENNTATNQTITYSIPFVNTPIIVANNTGLTITSTATTLTITTPNNTTTYSGTLILMGR